MKMKLQGAKLNNCDTIKVIRKCIGGICKRSWGISGPGCSMRCKTSKSTRSSAAPGVAKAPSLPLEWEAHPVHTAAPAVIPQEGESTGWRRSRTQEEHFDSCGWAAPDTSVGAVGWLQTPPQEQLWSSPHPGQLLLILPENGVWAGRSRERWLLTPGKLEVFPINFYEACVFLLVAGHAVSSLQTLLVWLPSVNHTLNRRNS